MYDPFWLEDFIEKYTYEKGHPPTIRILADKVIQTSPYRNEITQWAKDRVFNPVKYSMGTFDEKKFGDLHIIAQIQKHTWSHDKKGKKITGNFRGITLYRVT